ncbi:hypothetical protein G9A89_008225 [Geosiphon pyriformis]|nr:hypothetical protein G9A89_008225 [Geosiphon pyriformis]
MLQPLQLLIAQIVYTPITKLEKFSGEEDDVQTWINDVTKAITANNWNDIRALQAIPYFFQDAANFNSNSINHLANTFIIIKQEDIEAVTTYLGHFHQNLHQIQAIDTDYFTATQILNQFIHGLHSSILQHIWPLHPVNLQNAVTCTRNFELAELEANHAQVVNLVMNRSFDLDFKLKQFSNSINQKIKGYLANNHTIY